MSTKPEADLAEVIAFRDAAEYEAWLAEHVDRAAGVWLKIAKKGSGVASLTDDEAVDIGLCYGWISGQRKAYDEVYYLQKYVPRRPRSRWSQVNVRKVEALLTAGRMRPAGLTEVEAAKADGRWDAAYASQREATVPPRPRRRAGHQPAGDAGLRVVGQDRPVRRDPGPRHRPYAEDPVRTPPKGHGCAGVSVARPDR